jgi:magnesium-transporting ATPase (P-type)
VAQILHLGNARSLDPVLHPARVVANPYALLAVALSIALQLAAMYVEPLARVLGVRPLDLAGWALVLGLGAIPAVVGQARKLWRARRP